MERRVLWAVILMMVIAIAPAIFLPRGRGAVGPRGGPAAQPGAGPPAPGAVVDSPAVDSPAAVGEAAPQPRGPAAPPPTPEDTIIVSSPLYTYGVSTRGARLVTAELRRYESTARADKGKPVQLLRPQSDLLGLTLIEGADTLRLDRWDFAPSAPEVRVGEQPASLRLTASRGGRTVELTYTFAPDEYKVDVAGRVSGVGPNGALLLVGMGPGLANTEADSVQNYQSLALVTKREKAERHDFSDFDAGRTSTFSGPFEWTAVKSKYFVTALFAFDSTGGRISGVTATPPATAGDKPITADVRLSLPVGSSGAFGYMLYAGPMEQDRLRAIGHEFDDVNPYGWPGIRTLIRFFAVPTHWLLVFMHEQLGLAYGLALVVFGILVRVVLWPLNQKAMRASLQLQAIQPLVKDIQERYRNDPQRLQQEMFRLYKEHNVNPFGGCWPMLLPMPILIALFFVFQNAIELRGTAFLWLPDLSQQDPYYIIPLIMGLSMYALSKVGQMGMEPNPQMKMMLYVMPAVMTLLFLNFPSGLNLYYAVSNIASLPQQYLLARERMRATPPAAPAPAAAPADATGEPRASRAKRRRG